MSLWQFTAAVEGYVAAHTPESERGKEPLSDAEFSELADLIDR